ncbi:MAG: caspase domain-containing protein [Myxococcaceae bacterium]
MPGSLGAAFFLALCVLLIPSLANAQNVRRFAVIAGNDEGGNGTRPLLYAQDDARKIYDILNRVGGVPTEDSELVLNGSAEDFLKALADTERKIVEAQKNGERTALFVYYSGHAKDGALRLGGSSVPFDALKARLSAAPADIKVGIFDSCRSGELTRSKGARRAPAFEIETAKNEATKGLVILTSSSSDEDSQESDQIAGSYFSHHLASGLLGDADRSGDGRVTLSEAYAYAYDRTVADTAASAAGPQHPTFSYDLAGNGDLVMTDVATHKEGLVLAKWAPEGAWFLVDPRGFVVAEIWKPKDVERRIAVAAGDYRVKRRLADRLRIGEVTVAGGKMTVIDDTELRDAPFTDDPVKGVATDLRRSTWAFALSGNVQSFFDSPTRSSLFPSAPMLGVEANVRHFLRKDWIFGFDLAFGGAQNGAVAVTPEYKVPFKYSQLSAGSSLTVEYPTGSGKWIPFVGGRMALLMMTREFDAAADLPKQSFSTISPGLVGGLRYQLTWKFGVTLRGRVHYLLYNVDENRSLGYWEVATLLSYEL